MSHKDYKAIAAILHKAHEDSSSDEWKLIYDKVYTPVVEMLKADNPRFDQTRFSYAVATGKGIS